LLEPKAFFIDPQWQTFLYAKQQWGQQKMPTDSNLSMREKPV
jgi:hypothetical protein